MADIVFVAITVAFLALCVAYVIGCERIVGSEGADADLDGEPGELPGTQPAGAGAAAGGSEVIRQ